MSTFWLVKDIPGKPKRKMAETIALDKGIAILTFQLAGWKIKDDGTATFGIETFSVEEQ
jgi:hypothetical protein